MSARYEFQINQGGRLEISVGGSVVSVSTPESHTFRAIRQQSADIDQLRADLAAAVAERDRFAIERDQARLTLREIAQILIEQIGSVGPENAINAALRACGVIESMATRLAAIDAAPVVAWQDKSWRQDLYHRRPDPAQVDTRELIAKPAKD